MRKREVGNDSLDDLDDLLDIDGTKKLAAPKANFNSAKHDNLDEDIDDLLGGIQSRNNAVKASPTLSTSAKANNYSSAGYNARHQDRSGSTLAKNVTGSRLS